jgi:ABC-type branched-subunit amino acid transport system substrate-binding protein
MWSVAETSREKVITRPPLQAAFELACRFLVPVVLALLLVACGRHRSLGYDAIYAARLAVREVNRNGGIGDYRVELVALDDGGDPQLARQAAAALIVDPDVLVVVGHGLAETTEEARTLYATEGLPLIALGQEPLDAFGPDRLPAEFLEAYAEVTPFEEVAGDYAGPTYDALKLALKALEVAETRGQITRASVDAVLEGLQYEGLTGRVHAP